MKTRLLQLSLGLASTAVLALLLLRMLDVAAVVAAVTAADARLLGLGMAVHVAAMWVRSLVWRGLLPPRASTATLFRVSMVGFAVNYLMPVRIGELVRLYLVRRWCNVDSGAILASLVAERVLDGVAVSAILLAALLFVPVPGYVLAFGVAIASIFAALAAGLAIATWRASALVRLAAIAARPLPRRPRAGLVQVAEGFARNLQQVGHLRALAGLLALASLGWLCQLVVFYLVMLAVRLPASVPLALMGGSLANFATLLPSGPGAAGPFDAALIKLLVDVQQASIEHATAYALLVHSVVVVPIVVLGGLIVWRSDLPLGQLVRYGSGPREHAATPRAGWGPRLIQPVRNTR